jgi:pSer/pThr/pTyr-binding forkhead associated (FHA) protein
MDTPFLLWIITFTLFCLVVIQVLYLVYLSYIPTRRTQPRRNDSASAANNRQAPVNAPSPFAPPTPVVIPGGQSAMATPVPAAASPRTTQSIFRAPASPPPAPSVPAPVLRADPAPAPAMIGEVGRLVVLSGLTDMTEINLPGAEFGIGRFYNQERKVLVVMDEKSISREHAIFQYNPQLQQYFLTDKSSSYGTYILVKDQFEPLPPEQPQQIFNGDVVQFGNMVKVRFLLAGETRASVTQL